MPATRRPLFNELLKDADKTRVKLIQQRISLWKNALIGPEEALAQADDDLDSRRGTRLCRIRAHAARPTRPSISTT